MKDYLLLFDRKALELTATFRDAEAIDTLASMPECERFSCIGQGPVSFRNGS